MGKLFLTNSLKKFLYTSTTSIYGKSMVDTEQAVWVDETLTPDPRDIYDITKLTAELLCRDYFEKEGIETTVLRVSRFLPEAKAWHAGDVKTQISYWNLQPYSRSLISLETGQLIVFTAEDAKNAQQTAPDGGVAVNSNYQIHVNGNMAFSSHDQLTTEKSGAKRYAREMRVLEKVDGKWKIIGLSAHLYKP